MGQKLQYPPDAPVGRSPAVAAPQRDHDPGKPGTAARRVLRVLVADNCRDTADSLAMLVERWGHHVRVAYDGLAARELADADRPDVLLLDLDMPGLDGCALARRLRHRPDFKASIMIAVTGYGDEEHRLRCEEAGFDFSFVKPVAPAVLETLLHFEQTRRGGQPADAPAHARPPGILVVDDDAATRDLVGVALRQDGFDVWPAADGLEALQHYWRHRAAIDVVLLDVRMPGLDGPQTLAALREMNPHLRCCFMTADAGQYTEEALLACGAAALLHKPFRLPEAARLLRQMADAAPV
jgi:CheY-like chemotaxis protein